MATNAALQNVYDEQYENGYEAHHTPIDRWEESRLIAEICCPWTGQRVLEIGCGEGRLARHLSSLGADVTAIDYSPAAIKKAGELGESPRLRYMCCGLPDITDKFDRVVMQGVLEHFDDWQGHLNACLERLRPGGFIVSSSPSFLNPRGYVWQTLHILLGVPMSLTDLHAINPWDIDAWASRHHLACYHASCHKSWGSGEAMLADYAKRLPNALRDACLPTDAVPEFLQWLERAAPYFNSDFYSGATMAYRIGPTT